MRTAGLEQQVAAKRPDDGGERAGVGADARGIFPRIAHAEAAAEVQIAQVNARTGQFGEVARQALEAALEGSDSQDLRTKVRADALPLDPAGIAVLQIQTPRVRPVDAKLVLMVARWRCAGGRRPPRQDSRARPRARASGGAQPPQASRSSSASDSTLNRRMRARNASRISSRDFPTPEKTTRPAVDPGAAEAVELAAGNDVKSGAEAGQQPQDGEIRVGFDRVADGVRQAADCGVKLAVGRRDGGGAVNVRGRARSGCDLLEVHTFAEHAAAAPGKTAGVARRIEKGVRPCHVSAGHVSAGRRWGAAVFARCPRGRPGELN